MAVFLELPDSNISYAGFGRSLSAEPAPHANSPAEARRFLFRREQGKLPFPRSLLIGKRLLDKGAPYGAAVKT